MKWYRIRAAVAGPALVHLYGEVGWDAVTAADFLTDLAQVPGDVEVHLNSPGGEVFDGIAIYQGLKQRPGTVSVVVDSLAASIASVIAMAASPGQLAVSPEATMMIHDAHGMSVGSAGDMEKMAGLLNRASDHIASIYASRTGKTVAEWRSAMRAETWYFGAEAVNAGLADQVLAAPVARRA